MQTNTPTPSSLQPPKPLEIKGSIPYWDQEKAYQSFQDNVNLFNYVNFFWYYIEPDGSLKKYEYADENRDQIEFAHQNGVKVSAVIANLPEYSGATWDSKRVENVITDTKLRTKHIQEIASKLSDYNFDGVIIDYENVRSKVRNEYTDLIRELALRLHQENKIVTVVLHPKTGDRQNLQGNGAFQDWYALSLWADQLQIMAYGEHWDESESGPIASIEWIKKIINYAGKLKIPKEKIFLGIPLYGYDWDKSDDSKAKGMTYKQIIELRNKNNILELWDDYSQAPYLTYREGSHTHEVWFENTKSVEQKVNLAREVRFAGISFWRLGEEDPSIWQNLVKFK